LLKATDISMIASAKGRNLTSAEPRANFKWKPDEPFISVLAGALGKPDDYRTLSNLTRLPVLVSKTARYAGAHSPYVGIRKAKKTDQRLWRSGHSEWFPIVALKRNLRVGVQQSLCFNRDPIRSPDLVLLTICSQYSENSVSSKRNRPDSKVTNPNTNAIMMNDETFAFNVLPGRELMMLQPIHSVSKLL
jgi:hypothetical protein